MNFEEIKKNIYWVGVKDPELRVFDIIMETRKGSTYNSYLINDKKVAIIDTVKDGFFVEFLENIKNIIGDKKIDYIIVQHTELDHSGSLKKLLETYPEAQVVGSRAAITYLKDIVNKEFNFKYAEEEINLGSNTLQFISAPNLHWPDTMFTYIKEKKALFTCDVMGCHYCPKKSMMDSCIKDYFDEMEYYFNVIMGPFKKFVNMGLKKVENLDFDMIAPSHGPVHADDVAYYLNLYKEWAKVEEIKEKNIQIFYISAYKNTEKMAEFLCNKINEKGIKAEYHEITSISMDEITKLVEMASGIIVGTPTINQDAVKPAWDLLSIINPIVNRGKVAGAFGSYGWSGEGVGMITDRLKSLKFKVVENGFRFKFVPNEKDFKDAEQFLEKYIELL